MNRSFDPAALLAALDEQRRARGMSWSDVSKAIGVSTSTMKNMGNMEKRRALENRGGSGILEVSTSGELQIVEHDVILGLNIPNYPL